jgi:hypothetical protein
LAPLLLFSLLLLPAAEASAEPTAAAHGRVVVVGVDGLSWNVVDAMIARAELPALAALAARGVHARLATVEPVISPTVWTSIATGRSPAAHGITSFFASTLDVRVPTAFERLAASGARVGLYDWLATWPPARLPRGFVIPGWIRRDPSVDPPDVFARAGTTPFTWVVDDLKQPRDFALQAADEVRKKAPRFVALLSRFELDVAAVTFYCVDATSHRFWQPAFPAEPGAAPVIHEAMRGVDRSVGEIVAALRPDDALIVLSDHGFQARPDGPSNVWTTHLHPVLAAAGFDPARDGFVEQSGFQTAVVRVVPGPWDARESTLARLRAFFESARTAAGEPLYRVLTVDVAQPPPGVPGTGLRRRLETLAVRAFLWWLQVRFELPAHAWLVVQHRDDVLSSLAADSRVQIGGRELALSELLHLDTFSGGHDPTGVFLAAGPAFRHEDRRLDVSVLDVAPLVFQLAGRPIPDDLEHALRRDLLDPAWLAAHPPRSAPAASVATVPHPASRTGASDAELEERLKALGYLE